MNVTGSIQVAGEHGEDPGHSYSSDSGSGAGGSLFISVKDFIITGIVSASGGPRIHEPTTSNGPGGAGGDGRIRIDAYAVSGLTTPTSGFNLTFGSAITNASGDYVATFTLPSTGGDYVAVVNTTYNGAYGLINTSITVVASNNAPSITTPLFNTSTVYTTTDISANTTYTDADSDSGTVYFYWYVNGSNVYTETFNSVATGTVLDSVLNATNYSKGATINVSVNATDGEDVSTRLISSTLTVL
ncbi:MAG: hypothetical protein IIC81_08470, partial [Chloroflexi bacterium]|nr:hypothetical protein [Chloroflexota bacterium]